MSFEKNLSNIPYSVLLASYNGARFVETFLESCAWLKHANLIVRDDGSSDDTLDKIQEFVRENSVECTILTGEKLGAKNNFAKLLEHNESPYFFFADQDDVWEKHKISHMLKCMESLESQHGTQTPLLVYSDASLMDSTGNVYQNSFFKNAMLPKKWNENFRNVLVMPHVLGCTMLGNRALAKAALPVAEEAVMHDAWILLVASALGHVHEMEEPLVRYRQHDANVFGANFLTWRSMLTRILDGRKSKYKNIVQTQRQAGALLRHCGHLMSDYNRELCQAWAEVEHKSWFKRRITYAKYGFKKAGWLHNTVLWTCG